MVVVEGTSPIMVVVGHGVVAGEGGRGMPVPWSIPDGVGVAVAVGVSWWQPPLQLVIVIVDVVRTVRIV